MPNNTSSVYGPPMTSCDCAPMIDKLSICGFMSSVIVPGLLKRHVVIAGGLIGVDIHASAGIVRRRTVGSRRVRKRIDPGCRIAPVEIAWRCRDLPQRVVLVNPLQEQIDRRPITEFTVNLAPHETRRPNRIVLVGANNRVVVPVLPVPDSRKGHSGQPPRTTPIWMS